MSRASIASSSVTRARTTPLEVILKAFSKCSLLYWLDLRDSGDNELKLHPLTQMLHPQCHSCPDLQGFVENNGCRKTTDWLHCSSRAVYAGLTGGNSRGDFLHQLKFNFRIKTNPSSFAMTVTSVMRVGRFCRHRCNRRPRYRFIQNLLLLPESSTIPRISFWPLPLTSPLLAIFHQEDHQ